MRRSGGQGWLGSLGKVRYFCSATLGPLNVAEIVVNTVVSVKKFESKKTHTDHKLVMFVNKRDD